MKNENKCNLLQAEILSQLQQYSTQLNKELVYTPLIFFKERWQLKAKIESTESIIKVISRLIEKTNRLKFKKL